MDSILLAHGIDLKCPTISEINVSSVDELFDFDNPLPGSIDETDIHGIKFYSLGGWKLILTLKYPASLYFRGCLTVKCLAGCVEIDGFTLKPDYPHPCNVYSLVSHSASIFKSTCPELEVNKFLINELVTLNVYNELKDVLSNDTLKPSCILLLSKHVLAGFPKLSSEIQHQLLPSRRFYSGPVHFSDFEEFVNCVFDIDSGSRITKKIVYPQQIRSFTDRILNLQDLRMMVCGGKGVGKSTTTRFIINQVLSRFHGAVFIDFDIGQPEFTVPGCVSVHLISKPLLGPNYAHLNHPIKSIFLGFVSPDLCFNNFRSAITEVRNFCSGMSDFAELPWVVNTMGYVKGCGLLLINDIISQFNLSHVLEIRSSTEPKLNFVRPPNPQSVMETVENCPSLSYDLVTFSVITSNHKSSISPKTARELMTYFYFVGSSNELRIQTVHIQTDFSGQGRPFVSLLPNNSVPLRGEIVAVCSSDVSDVLKSCVGFGKVVSFSNNVLLLLTAVPESAFSSCSIVRGDLQLRNDFFNANLSDGFDETLEQTQILLTSGSKTLCPALFSSFKFYR